jgi:ornithine carbamoyltransferase
VVDFAHYSGMPTINALTDDEHPCQILADLQTIQERLGGWKGKRVCFLGDGDCNVARSWIWASARLGFELVIGAPKAFQPAESFMSGVPGNTISVEADAAKAVSGCDVVYTDVWVSMGKEAESAERIEILQALADQRAAHEARQQRRSRHALPARLSWQGDHRQK